MTGSLLASQEALQKLEIKPLLANGGRTGMRHRSDGNTGMILLLKLFLLSFHAKPFPQIG